MQPNVNQAAIRLVQEQNHLNDPIIVRYGYWVRDAFTNSFGRTILGERPILPDMLNRLKVTVQLIIAAELLTLLLAIGIGVYSAVRQYSIFDYSMTTLSFLGLAIPVFWLGLILQIQHLVLPVFTLATISIAGYSRFMRASMLEVVNADYIRTARAKGLIERRVILKHAFRNALIPLMTLAAIDFGTLFGGTVITETVYGLPGMGRYFIDALAGGETYVIMAWLMVTSVMVVFFNLVADIILGFLDPRIRLD
jgi:peptide/nickel transport system permease protein